VEHAAIILWLGSERAPALWARAAAEQGAPLVECERPEQAIKLAQVTSPLAVFVARPHDALARLSTAIPTAALIAVVGDPGEAGRVLALGAHDIALAASTPAEARLRLAVWRRHRGWRAGELAAKAVQEQLGRTSEALATECTRLSDLALRDELTGLGNRRSFSGRLELALAGATRHGDDVSILSCDCDGLKRINDTLGHATGDHALRQVAEILLRSLRTLDHAARIGGDEFGVIMPRSNAQAAELVAQRIRRRVVETIQLPGGLGMSLSIGVAEVSRHDPLPAGDLLARADAAMYAEKRANRGDVRH
jgi:diguanylate cyclase (GGDEF)-like protein